MNAKKKHYRMKMVCPQCGCSELTTMTPEEIREKYPDVENVELECGECMLKVETDMGTACPEWDEECKAKEAEKK